MHACQQQQSAEVPDSLGLQLCMSVTEQEGLRGHACCLDRPFVVHALSIAQPELAVDVSFACDPR